MRPLARPLACCSSCPPGSVAQRGSCIKGLLAPGGLGESLWTGRGTRSPPRWRRILRHRCLLEPPPPAPSPGGGLDCTVQGAGNLLGVSDPQ